jgi:hypothetical protein
MTDPITIQRTELDQYIRITAEKAIQDTLNELGIKRTPYMPWVSENYAVKVMGISLKKLKRAVERGVVRDKVDVTKKTHNKFLFRSDVQKLLNNPLL